MIVAVGNEDKLYDGPYFAVIQTGSSTDTTLWITVHGKRQNQMVKDSLDFLLDYLHDRYCRLPAALSFIL